MYAKYNHCCKPPARRKDSTPYCKPVISYGQSLTESDRMAKEVCSTMYVTTYVGPSCLTAGSGNGSSGGGSSAENTVASAKVQTTVPVIPGGEIPYVEVGTIPASLTIRQTATNVVALANDPYNPATRFSQYFPPAPIPYICPERIPNNDPKPSTRDCIPITRFIGSKDAPQTE